MMNHGEILLIYRYGVSCIVQKGKFKQIAVRSA
jgi:hypothetical protein